MEYFNKSFECRWSDFDINQHLSNVAYSKYCTETRMAFLEKHGITYDFFKREGLGPIISHEDISYIKEILPKHKVHCQLALLEISQDYSTGKFIHGIYGQLKQDNSEPFLSAQVIVSFAWFHLAKRRVISPPKDICDLFSKMPKHLQFTKVEKRNFHPTKIII